MPLRNITQLEITKYAPDVYILQNQLRFVRTADAFASGRRSARILETRRLTQNARPRKFADAEGHSGQTRIINTSSALGKLAL